MFLDKQYILANELLQHINIASSNISMLRKQLLEEGDESTILKYGNALFIDKYSTKLPNNIRRGIIDYEKNNEFCTYTCTLPLSYLCEEFQLNRTDIVNILRDKIVLIDERYNKFYVQFTEEFVNEVKGKTFYVLNETEARQCIDDKLISGFLCTPRRSNKKYLVWY